MHHGKGPFQYFTTFFNRFTILKEAQTCDAPKGDALPYTPIHSLSLSLSLSLFSIGKCVMCIYKTKPSFWIGFRGTWIPKECVKNQNPKGLEMGRTVLKSHTTTKNLPQQNKSLV